jgi:malate dehydrogenase
VPFDLVLTAGKRKDIVMNTITFGQKAFLSHAASQVKQGQFGVQFGNQASSTAAADSVSLSVSTSQGKTTSPTKVAIVGGAGNVGASLAMSLVEQSLCNEVALYDMQGNAAKGKALDLNQAAAVNGSSTFVTGGDNYEIIKDANVVVVTAGSPRQPGQSRDDLLVKSAGVIQTVCENIKQYAPDATIIMVSNPLDAMTQLAQKVTGFPPNRVFGMAGVLDSGRFKALIAEQLKVSPNDVQAMVLGGHGDTMVPILSNTTVSGVPVEQLIDKPTLDKIIDRVKNAGAEIVNLAGRSSYYGPGAAIAKMIKAVLKGETTVAPVCANVDGQYGLNNLYVGVPVRLGRTGVEQVLNIKMNPEELAAFQASVDSCKANIAKIPYLNPVATPAS